MLGAATARGFTLLELLLVLLILGIAYGVAAPSVGSGMAALEHKAAALQLGAGLRQTRARAIHRRTPVALKVDFDARSFSIDGEGKVFPLPAETEIKMYTASDEVIVGNQAGIRFFPDGSSTGGRITLIRNGVHFEIDVEWLTGMVTVQ